jgi:hypothetical protein
LIRNAITGSVTYDSCVVYRFTCLLIHLHDLVSILSIRRYGLIIRIVVEQVVLSVYSLLSSPVRHFGYDGARGRLYDLVALTRIDVKSTAVVIVVIVTHHNGFITRRQGAYRGAYGCRNGIIPAAGRLIINAVVIIVVLTRKRKQVGVSRQRGQEETDRMPGGPPTIRMVGMIGVRAIGYAGIGMIYIDVLVPVHSGVNDPGRGRGRTGPAEIMVACVAATAVDGAGGNRMIFDGRGTIFYGCRTIFYRRGTIYESRPAFDGCGTTGCRTTGRRSGSEAASAASVTESLSQAVLG